MMRCRIFGATFAELPFVATRQGYRREGHLHSLMRVCCLAIVRARVFPSGWDFSLIEPMFANQALDEMLEELGVKWLVLPAVKEVLPMWTQTFGFRALRYAACALVQNARCAS